MNLTDRLGALATRRNVLWLLALYMALVVAALPLAQARLEAVSGGAGPLDLELAYTPAQAYARLAALGAPGRQLYAEIALTLDVIYPLVYGLFFALTISYCFQRVLPAGHAAYRLALLPLAAAVADLFENAAIVGLLASYPTQLTWLALIAGVVTAIKWLLAGLSLLVVMIAIAAVINQRLRPPGPAGAGQ